MRPHERGWPCAHPAWVARARGSGPATLTAVSATGARLSALPGAATGERLGLRVAGEALEARVTAAGDGGCTVAFARRLDPLVVARLRGAPPPGAQGRRG